MAKTLTSWAKRDGSSRRLDRFAENLDYELGAMKMIPIRHASHDRLRRWRFRDRSNATGSVNIYISLHPDASSHDGSFYRGRHGPRQPLAHFAAFLLRKIDYRRRDGLHRQIRRGECLGLIARSTLD